MGSFMIRTLVIGLVALAPAGLGAAPVLVGHARVIDGDTLAVGRVRVRLWGIDAAEHAAPGGPEATAATRGGWPWPPCHRCGTVTTNRKPTY